MTPPIVVVGGGPAGSTVAMLLRELGHEVLLLERTTFPRFHVGESLLPCSQRIWSRLGLADELSHQGHTLKRGGELRIGIDPEREVFHASRMSFEKVPEVSRNANQWSYQVERAKFDAWLLEKAGERGVDVREGARFLDLVPGEHPTVVWQDSHGRHETAASFVVDASGRSALLARKFGYFQPEDRYQTSAVFGHFEGVPWPEGETGGYINVYLIENGWVWFIPLSGGRTSVGVVMNEPATRVWPRRPDDVLKGVLGRFAYLRARVGPARQISQIHVLRNLPYASRRLVGPGWALVGDAAFFVDPIHSSGVHLAFQSAEWLADAVSAHLAGDGDALDRYAAAVRRHHRNVRRNVSTFYRSLRYRGMMYCFVRGTGQFGRNWSGPVLRRISAWSFGDYSRFMPTMWLFWSTAVLGLAFFRTWHGITGTAPWGRHGLGASVRPLEPPISTRAEIEQRSAG